MLSSDHATPVRILFLLLTVLFSVLANYCHPALNTQFMPPLPFTNESYLAFQGVYQIIKLSGIEVIDSRGATRARKTFIGGKTYALGCHVHFNVHRFQGDKRKRNNKPYCALDTHARRTSLSPRSDNVGNRENVVSVQNRIPERQRGCRSKRSKISARRAYRTL
jgi:hypothetical protein